MTWQDPPPPSVQCAYSPTPNHILVSHTWLPFCKPLQVDARSGRVSELISSWAAAKNFVRLAATGGGGGDVAAVSAPLFVQAIIDPLSKSSQRLAPVLAFLRSVLDVDAELLLNPQARDRGAAQKQTPVSSVWVGAAPACSLLYLPSPGMCPLQPLLPDPPLPPPCPAARLRLHAAQDLLPLRAACCGRQWCACSRLRLLRRPAPRQGADPGHG